MHPSFETIWRAIAPHWPAAARVEQMSDGQFMISWNNADGSPARDVVVNADANGLQSVLQAIDPQVLSKRLLARVEAVMPPLEKLPADNMPFDLYVTEGWVVN